LTAALPQFDFQRVSAKDVIEQLNAFGSTVLLLIETKQALENIEAIASLDGVDVLLVGANDLSLELGVLGEWEHPIFQSALERIAAASHKSGKIFGICGLYTRPDIYRRVVRDLGARYVLGHLDIGLLAMAMNNNAEMLREVGNGLVSDMGD
jgi:2-keto-3-deoxy-L-rhamnonate aldolase RhmA